MPESNNEELKIPSGFVQDIKEAWPKNVSLRDRYGNSWPVKVRKVGNIWYFKDGWKKFVEESSLNSEDFMTFKYIGRGVFYVKMFGRNACEKKRPSNTCQKKQASNACENSKAKGPKDRNTERYEVVEEDDGDEDEQVMDAGPDTTRTQRGRKEITDWLGMEIFKSGRVRRPTNPYFVTKSKLLVHKFPIPKAVAEFHNIELPDHITLVDENGREFLIDRKIWGKRMYYCGDWRFFYRLNLLQREDKCVCEFIRGDDGELYLHTSIVRANRQQGMAEQDARLEKLLAKKTRKNTSGRASTGTGSSSGIPRPKRGEQGPAAHTRGSTFNAGPSAASMAIPNPVSPRQSDPNLEGPSQQETPTVHLSDESSERESAQLERRKKFRHDRPANLMDLQTRSGGPSRSLVSSLDIVHQYEAYALRDRMQQLGDDWRPEFQPDQPALVPDWRVYPSSSILGTSGLKVASEMARNIMLPADKAQLITMPHTQLEDTIHKALAEASLVANSLSLNLSFLRHENAEMKRSYDEYPGRLNSASVEIEEARKLRAEAEGVIQENERLSRQMVDLKLAYNELKSNSLGKSEEIEIMKGELTVSKTELDATKVELEKVKAEAAQNYEAGRKDERDAFITSVEYKRTMDEVRFNGARDFRYSNTFQMLALEPAADFIFDGFMKAIDYMVKEGCVVSGFDPVAFEQFASAKALRPSSATSFVEYKDFPEFGSLGPVDSDEEETEVPNPEGDGGPAAAKD